MPRIYSDDAEILALAECDGCAMTLRAALAQGEDKTTAVATDRRVYIVSTRPGDCGFSAFEVDSPALMPLLLTMLRPIIGPIDLAQMRPHDRDPSAVETRH